MKTLVVRRGEGDYLFVLVPGRTADLVAEAARPARRSRACRCRPPPEAFEATGFERGTITPLGSTTAWPVVADLIVAERGEITLGSGVHEVAIGVDAKALLEATAATVADVTDPQ